MCTFSSFGFSCGVATADFAVEIHIFDLAGLLQSDALPAANTKHCLVFAYTNNCNNCTCPTKKKRNKITEGRINQGPINAKINTT